ncbi:MAG: putative lipopolysaccharide heptosyltransferase III [Verrucomicrobia bacterium]|nr:putative lipopolysaccharide heptosyltransferase III [Verrucomicrobiota bacterium]
MTEFCNILIVQLGDIGDVVLTTPTIRAVKEAHPDARVSILVRPPFGDLLRADPNLHEVIGLVKSGGSVFHALGEQVRFIRRLRQARYDLVIHLRTGDRGSILTLLTGARERVGWGVGPGQNWKRICFTRVIRDSPPGPPTVHPGANQSLRMVRAIGMDTTDSTPRLHVAPADHARAVELLAECGLTPDGQWVTINPCARWKYKEWDGGKWREVMDRLWEAHRLPAVLIGSREEAAACDGIIAGCKGRAFNLAGKTSLGELAALIAMSTLHLGVDSAAPHIAAAVGTSTVTIHGPTDWRAWRIADDRHRMVTPAMDCVPCHRKGCDDSGRSLCLEQLEVATVMKAVEEKLQKKT